MRADANNSGNLLRAVFFDERPKAFYVICMILNVLVVDHVLVKQVVQNSRHQVNICIRLDGYMGPDSFNRFVVARIDKTNVGTSF